MLKVDIEKIEYGLARNGVKTKDFLRVTGSHKSNFMRRAREGKGFNDTTLYKLSKLLNMDVSEFCIYEEK